LIIGIGAFIAKINKQFPKAFKKAHLGRVSQKRFSAQLRCLLQTILED
jgi:hypothetical protein